VIWTATICWTRWPDLVLGFGLDRATAGLSRTCPAARPAQQELKINSFATEPSSKEARQPAGSSSQQP